MPLILNYTKVFSRPGERYAQCCFASRVPFGGGGVMIWGGAFFWRFIVLMSPEVAAQAVALHNDGRSIRYIANLLGIPRRTVSDAIPQN
jgi:hypothetical protein